MILFLVCLLSLTGVHSQETTFIKAERGSSVILECSRQNSEACMLIKDLALLVIRPAVNEKYRILDNQSCVINITNLELTDEGKYGCSLFTVKSEPLIFNLTVTVTPEDPVLVYMAEPVSNGSKRLIEPDHDDNVLFHCKSSGGYPKPSIYWTVNNEETLSGVTTDVTGDQTSLYNADSTFNFNFGPQFYNAAGPLPSDNKEKAIACRVRHEAYETGEKIVYGFFSRKYPTSIVKIQHDGSYIINVNDNEYKLLRCEANGMPDPVIYEWKVDNLDWEKGGKTLNVSKPGDYICRTRNDEAFDFVSSEVLRLKESSNVKNAALGGSQDVGAIIGIVIGTIVILIIAIAIVTVLYRKERACFKPDRPSNPHSGGGDSNVENGMKAIYENELANVEKEQKNDKDGVTPAPNHQ